MPAEFYLAGALKDSLERKAQGGVDCEGGQLQEGHDDGGAAGINGGAAGGFCCLIVEIASSDSKSKPFEVNARAAIPYWPSSTN